MVWRTSVELVDYDLYKVFLVINNTEGLVSFTPVHRRNYIRCNSMFSKDPKLSSSLLLIFKAYSQRLYHSYNYSRDDHTKKKER